MYIYVCISDLLLVESLPPARPPCGQALTPTVGHSLRGVVLGHNKKAYVGAKGIGNFYLFCPICLIFAQLILHANPLGG